MEMERIRGKIPAVTIVVCSLLIGTFSYTLDAVANDDPMYELTVAVVGEYGTVEPNSGSYSAGTVVTLTATPEPDYYMRQWTGTDDDTSCALTNTVTMDSDKTVTVEFGLPHHFLVVGGEPNLGSIQYAIDAAGCGDVIILNAGVYYEDINFNGKNIIVTSTNPDDPMCVASTIIQGTGAGPVVTFSGGESQSCWLYGLTITGGNTTGDGGGICGNGTEATIKNCIITNNHADGAGGGVSNCNGTIERCTITGNTANSGGGMYNYNGSPTVLNCKFTENLASELGGGMLNRGSNPTLTKCTFGGNCAENGGGMFNLDSSCPILTNCVFIENSASNSGGGMGNDQANIRPILNNCLFSGNSAVNKGGGIYNDDCGQILTNCTFFGNSARYNGGISNDENHMVMTNCIFWGNWDINGMDESSQFDKGDELIINYCCVQGWTGALGGTGNIGADPLFADADGIDNIVGTEDDNLRLLAGSPCIDAGDNSAVPPSVLTDLDGNPRIVNGIIDMGAYESLTSGPRTRRVPAQYGTIQAAIETAVDGDVVLVADGTYTGDGNRDIDFKGKAITVRSENGPQTCTIDCQGEAYDHHHRGFYFHNAESEYAVLEGFTILNGVHGSGGGIFCTDGASPTIRNNIIEGNRISFGGDGGGGIACKRGASPVIVGNVIRNNYCEPGGGGGGIHCYEAGSPLICYNVITGNHANGGGGIDIAYGTNGATIVGNLIVANDAIRAGAIQSWATNCDLTISNNTIVGNVAEYTSGGIYIEDTINAAITNCIIWGNRDQNGTIESSQITGSSTNYSCIQGWTGSLGGIGNIGDNPLFVDADGIDNIIGTEDDNLRLLAGSPCVDAGDNSAVPPSVLTDLDGNPRIAHYVVDMGAYEFQGPFKRYYHVDGVNGDNTNDGLTPETAFKTIQRGINVAEDYETVLVWPGVYNEEIGSWGDAITVKSAADAAIVETDYGYAFSFFSAEGTDTVLSNFIIRDSQYGIYLVNGASPTLRNLTIVNNDFGISAFNGADPDISNCIFFNNYYGDLFRDPVPLQAKYSCIEEGGEGEGNISIEPGFVDANSGDYHLLSERGRYWPAHDVWVLDDVTSPCIDGGDPAVDPSNERMPNGGRINMGAYGNTAYASMSECWSKADFNCDGIVNFRDFAIFAQDWLETTLIIPEPNVPDVTPPAPVPAIITIGAVSPTSIMMTASEAFDESGVEYYFEALSAGGHDSGWIGARTYTDASLIPDTTYCYRVKARDKSANYNETIWSLQVCAVTVVIPDTLPPLPDPMQWDSVVDANGYDGLPREILMPPYGAFDYGATMRAIDADDQAPVGVAPAEVEYYFECIDESGFNSGWRTVADCPNELQRRIYTVKVGTAGQYLRFRVKTRDASDNHNETAWSITYPAM